MKALWILNSPIGTAARVLGYSHAASGTCFTDEGFKMRIATRRKAFGQQKYVSEMATLK